jgi:hypothetical protein
MTGRLLSLTKDARALVLGRTTFFDLSGELRNQIHNLALEKQYQGVPPTSFYLNKLKYFLALVRTSSHVYQEAWSHLVEREVVYVPVMAGMHYSYGGELKKDYGLSKETTHTIAASLM